MILYNKWYPLSTNMRSIRWESSDDPRPPFRESLLILLCGGAVPIFQLITMFVTGNIVEHALGAVASLAVLPLHDWINPIQKNTGVLLSGVRLAVLQGYLDRPLDEVAACNCAHKFVDEFLADKMVQDAAYEIMRYQQGKTHIESLYNLSLETLHHAASAVALKVRHPELHHLNEGTT